MNFLQRMPQGAKVALVAVLLVAAVAAWYISFFRPNQAAQQPATPTPAPTPEPSAPLTTARPLEVLPVPFLVTEAPRAEQPPEPDQSPAAAATTQPRVTVPPNPFVPLIIETAPTAVAQPNPPAPALTSRPATAAVTPQPIPSQTAQVQVRQPTTPLPRPGLPGTRPTPSMAAPSTSIPSAPPRLAQGTARTSLPPAVSLGSGALPIRLAPLERELSTAGASTTAAAALDIQPTAASGSSLEFARAEIDARLAQVLEPKSSLGRAQETTQESSLARFVREQNLKLSGVVLGPTSVAIFQSKDGFTVLPVGRTLPGSDVLLKSLSAKEALLVQGSETLNLTMDNP
ncbi:MAG: competence protein [Meiothermus sp.]|nr:MAG: competence protein [Meiothermus sp.]